MQISQQLNIKWERVLILGNWSYKNMGDEIILLGTIRLLQQQGKKILISAYDPEWLKSFFSQFPDMQDITYLHEFPKGIRSGFHYFFSPRIKEIIQYRQVDTVIIWGGEILTEESKNAYRYWNLALLPLADKLKKINLYLMGGIQAPKKSLNCKLFGRLLKRTKAVYARDEDSVHALEKNGEKFYPNLLAECKSLLQEGYELAYVPVSKWESPVYNDPQYQTQLEKDLNITMESIDWEENFSTFLQKVKGADIIITGRLHLFLIASYLWVKTKVFPYQKKILKMTSILERLGILK